MFRLLAVLGFMGWLLIPAQAEEHSSSYTFRCFPTWQDTALLPQHGNTAYVDLRLTFQRERDNEHWQISNFQAVHMSPDGFSFDPASIMMNRTMYILNNYTSWSWQGSLPPVNGNYTGGMIGALDFINNEFFYYEVAVYPSDNGKPNPENATFKSKCTRQ